MSNWCGMDGLGLTLCSSSYYKSLYFTLGGGETHNLYQKDNTFIIIKARSRLCWGRQKDNPFVEHKKQELVGQLDDVACPWSCNLSHVTWKRNYRKKTWIYSVMVEYNIQTHGFNCPWNLETSLCCPCWPCQTRIGVLVFEKKKRRNCRKMLETSKCNAFNCILYQL